MVIHLKLAKSTLFRNKQQYSLFVFAVGILLALNFIFLNLMNNTTLKNSSNGVYVIAMTRICAAFVLFLSFIFMFYVNSFIMKQRNGELGLFNILGLTRGDLRLIIFLENCFLYLLSLILGLILGTSFLKLAFLILQKFMHIKGLQEQFGGLPFVQVAIIFMIMFGFIFLYDIFCLQKIKPMALWNQAYQGEKRPKNHWLMGILGVLLLAGGYAIAVSTKPNLNSLIQFIFAIFLVVIGIYLTFIAGSITLLSFLQKRPQFYYQPNHFISISGMLYRMKQNGAGLASICLLCTTILVTLITTISVYQGTTEILKLFNPYDVMLTTNRPLTASDQQRLHVLAQANQVQMKSPQKIKMTVPTPGIWKDNKFQLGNSANSTDTITTITLADYNRLEQQQRQLKAHQILIYTSNQKSQPKNVIINGASYQVIPLKHFKLYYNYGHSIWRPIIIVSANEQVAQQINHQPWQYVQGFNVEAEKANQQKFAQQIQQKFKLDVTRCSDYAQNESIFNAYFGGLLFLGIITCLAMTITAVLLIYYKQVAEGYADQKRFVTMQQVGLSKAAARKAIHSQVLTVFLLPIIMAIVNTIFALPAIINVLKQFSLYNQQLITLVTFCSIVILAVAYILVYTLTTKTYEHLVHA